MLRIVAAAVLVLAALSGCASSSGGLPPGACLPERPRVSADVVRPGGSLTVSVSAALCRPRFERDRRLALVLQDAAGHRTRLATVRAFPSGAFEREVRIPADVAAGDAAVLVTGVVVPCPDTASCAAYGAALAVVDSRPDFSAAEDPNRVAAAIAERMQAALEGRRGFASLAIVPDGVEAVLLGSVPDATTAAVRRAFATGRASVPASDRAIARAARLHLTFVQRDPAALERLTLRIAHDDG